MKFVKQLDTAFIIIVIYYKDLNNRVTLKTLKVLIILNDLNTEALLWLDETNIYQNLPKSIIEIKTISPSKIFILSLIYPVGNKAHIFKNISTMKIYVKTLLALKLKLNYVSN